MTYSQARDGSWDRREGFSTGAKNIQGTKGSKVSSNCKGTQRFLTPKQPLGRSQTTCQSPDDSLRSFFSYSFLLLCLRKVPAPLPNHLPGLPWKAPSHLCGLPCEWLWRAQKWTPKFFAGRLQECDLVLGPPWSLGTPSMASVATSTASTNTFCMLAVLGVLPTKWLLPGIPLSW